MADAESGIKCCSHSRRYPRCADGCGGGGMATSDEPVAGTSPFWNTRARRRLSFASHLCLLLCLQCLSAPWPSLGAWPGFLWLLLDLELWAVKAPRAKPVVI